MQVRNRSAILLLLAVAAGCGSPGPPAPPREEDPARARLQQHRNLGKAFYENPGAQNLAPDELRKALALNPDSAREHLNLGLALLRVGENDEGMAEIEKARAIDPALPHTYFNLGIEYKKRGENERASEEFEQMIKLVPTEAKSHYQLGVLYRQNKNLESAIPMLEKASELAPSLAAPHFQLFNIYRRSDRERAMKELARFKELKAAQQGAAVGEDVNWSFYSELYDEVEPGSAVPEAVAMEFEEIALDRSLQGDRGRVALLDADADGKPDALAWSDVDVLLLRNVEGKLEAEPLWSTGEGATLRRLAAGDYDNDGFHDVAAAASNGGHLIENQEGQLASHPRKLADGNFEAVLWVDYDHDYDLDLLLTGTDHKLLRNNGDGTFADVSADFPFDTTSRGMAAATLELVEDNGNDIVIAYADGVTVYHDRMLGRYKASLVEGATPKGDSATLDVVDVDNDGFLDLALTWTHKAGATTQILENHDGAVTAGPEHGGALAWADLQNRGWTDAVAAGRVLINESAGRFEPQSLAALDSARAAAAADFNGDGLEDLLVVDNDRNLRVLANTTKTGHAQVTVSLEGVKSAKLAEGSRVEVRAGRVYRKRIYRGVPLVFGLAKAESIDTVRITWTNGLIQNESEQLVGMDHRYVEKPRLSGSCPMIFTWNGEEFEYISEVLGVAPLGASLGGGKFFPVDHDEYVWIRGEQLRRRDGFYEVRITEELREVAYLDQVKLIAVDHPSDVDVYTNEKFKAPPFPEFRLFGVAGGQKVAPSSARDHRGRNVLARLAQPDGRYVDGFERTFRNRAERHWLTLDFPDLRDSDDAMLFLTGWVDWADASTIVAASQNRAIEPPYVQVKDGRGQWQTVIEDLGLPGGRPRTMVVDLSGKFLSVSREIRIVTNMCLYWDEIFAARGVGEPEAALPELALARSELRFRGFSQNQTHPQRTEPESFDYARVRPTSVWNPTPGNYTAYGRVDELIEQIDDRYVILGAGDELTLRFAAMGEPPLPGWRRDFLLFVDGWAKEHESNTAFGDSVEPLPFHSMTSYPYGADEHYPQGPLHREYLETYINRPALRLIRPLRRP